MLKKLAGALLFSQAAQSVSEIRSFDRVSTVASPAGNFLVLSMDLGEQNQEINEIRTRKNVESHIASQKHENDDTCKDKKKPNSNIK